jgi:hypothetical protein
MICWPRFSGSFVSGSDEELTVIVTDDLTTIKQTMMQETKGLLDQIKQHNKLAISVDCFIFQNLFIHKRYSHLRPALNMANETETNSIISSQSLRQGSH